MSLTKGSALFVDKRRDPSNSSPVGQDGKYYRIFSAGSFQVLLCAIKMQMNNIVK